MHYKKHTAHLAQTHPNPEHKMSPASSKHKEGEQQPKEKCPLVMCEGAEPARISALGRYLGPSVLLWSEHQRHQLSWLALCYSAHLPVLCCLTPETAACRPKLLPETPRQVALWGQLPVCALPAAFRKAPLPEAQQPQNCLGPGSNRNPCLPSSGPQEK